MNDADIVCLQEVQADHYEQFFQRELFKVGYDGKVEYTSPCTPCAPLQNVVDTY